MSVEITKHQKREVREWTEEAYSCDVCGEPAQDPRPSVVGRVRVFREVGMNYGQGGGDSTRTCFDYCVMCWEAVVVPALKALGSGPRTEERDW